MQKVIIACLAAAVVAGCDVNFAQGKQGSGTAKTESRTVEAFTQVTLTGSPKVEIKIGSPQSVEVTTDDNLIADLKTTVSSNELKVGFEKSANPKVETVVRIVVPKLEGLKVTGSGSISAAGIDAESFDASVTGSGRIVAEGKAKSLSTSLTGSGSLDLAKLLVETAETDTTGSGNTAVNASKELIASITGSGSVESVGTAKVISKVTGSGNVDVKRPN